MHAQLEPHCPPDNVGVMTEKNTAPSFLVSYEPYLCASLTAGAKQSSKTTGSLSHQSEPNCPRRHAIPLARAIDSVRRGREATWSLIMNPRGLCFLLQQVQRQFILAVNHISIYRQQDYTNDVVMQMSKSVKSDNPAGECGPSYGQMWLICLYNKKASQG